MLFVWNWKLSTSNGVCRWCISIAKFKIHKNSINVSIFAKSKESVRSLFHDYLFLLQIYWSVLLTWKKKWRGERWFFTSIGILRQFKGEKKMHITQDFVCERFIRVKSCSNHICSTVHSTPKWFMDFLNLFGMNNKQTRSKRRKIMSIKKNYLERNDSWEQYEIRMTKSIW